MIKLSDLVNRVYKDKICKEFDYMITIDENEEYDPIRANFKKILDNIWKITVFIPRNADGIGDHTVYDLIYQLPNKNMNLETIAGIGLSNCHKALKEEIQCKTMLDFTLGQILGGI